MKEIFNDIFYEDESIVRNNCKKKKETKKETKSSELSLIIKEIETLTPNVISYKSNFTQEEYSALQSSKENLDIVFKTADERGGWIIMDKNYHRDKIVKEHLLSNVYKVVSIDSDKKYLKI